MGRHLTPEQFLQELPPRPHLPAQPPPCHLGGHREAWDLPKRCHETQRPSSRTPQNPPKKKENVSPPGPERERAAFFLLVKGDNSPNVP